MPLMPQAFVVDTEDQFPLNPMRVSGLIYETVPRHLINGSNVTLLNTQRLSMVALYLPKGITVNLIGFVSGTTPLSGGVHQFFGLYDDSLGSSHGVGYGLLASSADDGAGAWAANSLKTLAMTVPFLTNRSGLYYLGIMIQATVPSMLGLTSSSVLGQLSPITVGSANTGLSALPDPASAPSTGASFTPYAGVA